MLPSGSLIAKPWTNPCNWAWWLRSTGTSVETNVETHAALPTEPWGFPPHLALKHGNYMDFFGIIWNYLPWGQHYKHWNVTDKRGDFANWVDIFLGLNMGSLPEFLVQSFMEQGAVIWDGKWTHSWNSQLDWKRTSQDEANEHSIFLEREYVTNRQLLGDQ